MTTESIITIKYRSVDGLTFDNPEECTTHEEMYEDSGVTLYKPSGIKTKYIEEAYMIVLHGSCGAQKLEYKVEGDQDAVQKIRNLKIHDDVVILTHEMRGGRHIFKKFAEGDECFIVLRIATRATRMARRDSKFINGGVKRPKRELRRWTEEEIEMCLDKSVPAKITAAKIHRSASDVYEARQRFKNRETKIGA